MVAQTVLLYNAAVFGVMSLLYGFIGFRKHFRTPRDCDSSTAAQLIYFSSMTHSMIGAPDIYPRTQLARLLVSVHALLVFLQIGGVLLFATSLHRAGGKV